MNHRVRLFLFAGCLGAGCLGAGCRAPAPEAAASAWQCLPAPTAASLRGLSAVDAAVAWLGGAGGTLLRTVDGGRSWQDVRPADASACDFRDLHAFDADTCVAMVAGQPARLYRTGDGGRSWRIVLADAREDAFFDAIAFAGEHGVLFGDPLDGTFSLWTSRDAGRTWAELPAERRPRARAGEAAYAASGSCVALVGEPPRLVFATGGSAAQWWDLAFEGDAAARATALPLLQGEDSQGAFGIAVRGAAAVAVGGDYRQPQRADGTAAWSDDGGRTWHAAAGGAGGFRSAVVWLDDARLLAVGSHGASRSSDGGRTWSGFGDLGCHSLAIGGDGSVWACGADGRVARLRGTPR